MSEKRSGTALLFKFDGGSHPDALQDVSMREWGATRLSPEGPEAAKPTSVRSRRR